MLTRRRRLRWPAGAIAGALLLAGAGEAVGVGACIHHGIDHHAGVLSPPVAVGHAVAASAPHHTHAHEHTHEPGGSAPVGTGSDRSSITPIPPSDTPLGGHSEPHDDACRILCVGMGQATAPEAELRATPWSPDAVIAPESPALLALEIIKPTERRHFLPPSQGPPARG